MRYAHIIDHLNLGVKSFECVSGGDINHCFKLFSSGEIYFLKINNEETFPEMFVKEAAGLACLKSKSKFKIPEVLDCGDVDGTQYLLLEWIERSNKENWEEAGRSLALMHQNTHDCFGFPENNFIGSVVQINEFRDSWKTFFRDCRVLAMIEKLKPFLNPGDERNASRLCDNSGNIFPDEPPALVHGDLWSGNLMFSSTAPCIYDPAVYYGHREMDIGMTKLFGGFPQVFYDAYNEVYPLEKRWKERLDLSQLYPLLVHAVLFGGNYINAAKRILLKYS